MTQLILGVLGRGGQPTVFLLDGLSFLFFPEFPFGVEWLSSYFLVGGPLKTVGRSPGQPPRRFKMSSATGLPEGHTAS